MPGAEERPALIYHYGVGTGRLSLEQMCRYLAETRKQYHLYPRKGVLEPGSDADIVVWDPEMVWTLSKETQQSAAGYCPLEIPVEGKSTTGLFKRRADCRERTDFKGKSGNLDILH